MSAPAAESVELWNRYISSVAFPVRCPNDGSWGRRGMRDGNGGV